MMEDIACLQQFKIMHNYLYKYLLRSTYYFKVLYENLSFGNFMLGE